MVAAVVPPPEIMFYDENYVRKWLQCDGVPCVGDTIDGYEVVGTRRHSGAEFLGRPIVYVYVRKLS